jgi:hypothetical protein
MHYIYLPAAKLLYLITLFQKTYLKLNGDYCLFCGLLQRLQYSLYCTEKTLQVNRVKVTLRRLRLRLKHNKRLLTRT